VSPGGGAGLRGEINVTPLVDVVLVLLILFMGVAPMLRRGKEVALPPARSAEPGAAAGPLVVSVTADGVLWLEDRRCDEAQLARAARADPDRPVLLRGDGRATVGEVRRATATLRQAGVRAIRVAVERRAGGET
jgi:biopolymer transport protein ExbD